jgi:hypothetical protein
MSQGNRLGSRMCQPNHHTGSCLPKGISVQQTDGGREDKPKMIIWFLKYLSIGHPMCDNDADGNLQLAGFGRPSKDIIRNG